MKNVMRDFFEIFGNSVLVLSLILSSFLLLINVYHYQEVNIKYKSSTLNSEKYNNYKKTIDNLEASINNVNTDAIIDQNKRMALKTAEGQIKKCISSLKENKFYNLESDNFNAVDLYEINDLLPNLQYQCLFIVNYNIYDSLDKYLGTSDNYTYIRKNVEQKNDELKNYSEFIKNELLQNSSYGYSTDNTRNSIFNKLKHITEVNNFNYYNMLKSFEEMSVWYINEAGGNYE